MDLSLVDLLLWAWQFPAVSLAVGIFCIAVTVRRRRFQTPTETALSAFMGAIAALGVGVGMILWNDFSSRVMASHPHVWDMPTVLDGWQAAHVVNWAIAASAALPALVLVAIGVIARLQEEPGERYQAVLPRRLSGPAHPVGGETGEPCPPLD